MKEYVDATQRPYLLAAHAQGRNNVLIIDEAQNLSAEVLEQLRLLTNLETNERKLLQIILIGQPELRLMLEEPELRQLAQRVIARYHLEPLSAAETADYIRYRLSVAGAMSTTLFRLSVLKQIHRLTHGVPRRINLLCDRALLGAYAEGKHEVDHRIVDKAAAEVFGLRSAAAPIAMPLWRPAVLGVLVGVTIAGAVSWILNNGFQINPAHAEIAASTTTAHKDQRLEKSMQAPSSGMTVAAGAADSGIEKTTTTPATAAPLDMDDPSKIDLRNRNDAIRQLAQLWGMSPPGEGLPCLVAQKENLRCYTGTGIGLDEIRRLDRPVVLTLRDDSDTIHYTLLTKLTDTNATLRIGGVTQTVSTRALVRIYKGELVMLWRAPYTYREFIGLGHHGKEADWIAAQLAKMDGTKGSADSQVFDMEMVRRVRAFQLGQGMKADGEVGKKTSMHLNRVAGMAEPHLQNTTVTVRGSSGE